MLLNMLTAIVLAGWFSLSQSYPGGPPIGSSQGAIICTSMFPSGHGAPAALGTVPFQIDVSSTCYKENQKLHVRIRRMDQSTAFFKGYFIEARTHPSEANSYGMFSSGSNPNMRTLDCFQKPASAASQNTAQRYWYQIMDWTAPHSNFTSNLVFVATIVHEFRDFYMSVQSPTIHYNSNCSDNGTLAAVSFTELASATLTTTTTTTTTTTPVYATASSTANIAAAGTTTTMRTTTAEHVHVGIADDTILRATSTHLPTVVINAPAVNRTPSAFNSSSPVHRPSTSQKLTSDKTSSAVNHVCASELAMIAVLLSLLYSNWF